MPDKDDDCHRYGTEGGRVHDDLCGVVRIIIEFQGVHGRVDGGRDGAVNEEDDGADGCEGARDEGVGAVDHGQADEGENEEFEEADDPDFFIKPVDLRLRELDANGKHGDRRNGFGRHFHDGPEVKGFGIEGKGAAQDGGNEDVDDGHLEDDLDRVSGREAAPAGLVEAQRVEANALNDEDDDLDDHGFGQIRRLPVDDEGFMGKDEDDEGYAQVARVVEHEGVTTGFRHACVVVTPFADDIGYGKTNNHENGNTGNDVDAVGWEAGRVNVGENEAGDDEVE